MANVSGISSGTNSKIDLSLFEKSNGSNTNVSNVSGYNSSTTEEFDLNKFITAVNNSYEGNSPIVKGLSSDFLYDSYQELYETFSADMKKDAAKIDASINMLETSKCNLSFQLSDKERELINVNGEINTVIKQLKNCGIDVYVNDLPDSYTDPIPNWMYTSSMVGSQDLIKKYISLKEQQNTLNGEILSIKGNINSIEAAQVDLFYSKFKLDPRYNEFGILDGYSQLSSDLNDAMSELKVATDNLNKLGSRKFGFKPLDGSATYDITAMEDPAFNAAIMKYNFLVNRVNNLSMQMSTYDNYLNSIGVPFSLGLSDTSKSNPLNLVELRYLDDEQIKFLSYLKKYYGQDKATEYYNSIIGDINRIKGQEEAMKLVSTLDLNDEGQVKECLSNLGIVIESGFSDGINNFVEGLKNTILADGKVSTDDYKALYFLKYLEENAPKYYSAVYQESSSIGNMAPSITASVLVSILGAPGLAPTVASVLMGVSAGGNAREKALQMGSDQLSSILYGCLIGCSETMLGEFLGNIPGISASSAFSLSGFLKEGGEEFLQEYVDAFLQAGILNQEINLDEVASNAQSAFIMGAFTSFLLNGAQGTLSLTLNGIDYAFNADQISSYLEQANDYINSGDVDVSKLTNTLLGNVDYMYTNSSGEVGVISSGELMSFLSDPAKFVDGVNNGTYDLDVITALQKYCVENYDNINPKIWSNYSGLVSDSGVEFNDVSKISGDYSVGMLNQNYNAFSEYCKYLDGLDSDELTYELSEVHELYCGIQDGQYIVDGEILSRISSLETRFQASISDFSNVYEYTNLKGFVQSITASDLRQIFSAKAMYNRYLLAVSLGYLDSDVFLGIMDQFMNDYGSVLSESEISMYNQLVSDITVNTFCYDTFDDCAQNIRLNAESIYECALSNPDFLETIPSDVYDSLSSLCEFYKKLNGQLSENQVDEYTRLLGNLSSSLDANGKSINDYFLSARSTFKQKLIDSISSSGNSILGSDSSTVTSSDGHSAQLFTISSSNVEHFNFIIRSMSIGDYMYGPGAMDSYNSYLSTKKYLSYSVVDETLFSSYGKNRAVFGFFDIGSSDVLSATTHDGQTNQVTLKPGKYITKQQFLDIDSFMGATKTGSYNEVVLSNESVLQPSCILVYDQNPSDEMIKIAESFGLPLVYIDESSYPSHVEQGVLSSDERAANWYNNTDRALLESMFNKDDSSKSTSSVKKPAGFVQSDDFDD